MSIDGASVFKLEFLLIPTFVPFPCPYKKWTGFQEPEIIFIRHVTPSGFITPTWRLPYHHYLTKRTPIPIDDASISKAKTTSNPWWFTRPFMQPHAESISKADGSITDKCIANYTSNSSSSVRSNSGDRWEMEEPIVTVEQGKLRGKTGMDYDGRNYYSFQGIPYAKPPLGKLRFKVGQLACSIRSICVVLILLLLIISTMCLKWQLNQKWSLLYSLAKRKQNYQRFLLFSVSKTSGTMARNQRRNQRRQRLLPMVLQYSTPQNLRFWRLSLSQRLHPKSTITRKPKAFTCNGLGTWRRLYHRIRKFRHLRTAIFAYQRCCFGYFKS